MKALDIFTRLKRKTEHSAAIVNKLNSMILECRSEEKSEMGAILAKAKDAIESHVDRALIEGLAEMGDK